MNKQRWTIRGMDQEVIGDVRRVQTRTGCSLGEIVTRALRITIPKLETEMENDLGFSEFLTKLNGRA